MARVCLVRPLLSPAEFNGYPLNLLILASALRNAGDSVSIEDFDFLKEVDPTWQDGDAFALRAAKQILRHSPSYVGITSMCSNYVLALDLAATLKQLDPAVHITFGGPHVSLCALETLQGYDAVDTAVIGEGEITYPELIRAIEGRRPLAAVQGIAYRDAGGPVSSPSRPLLADLNQSPRPAYDLIDMGEYIAVAPHSYFEIYAGSGCPFRCTFCSTSIVWERLYRTMSAERIVGEIEHLRSSYDLWKFNLIHDNLTSHKPFIREIASRLSSANLAIRWGFSSRIDTIDHATAETVSNSGCDYIFFGVESGSENIQRTMGKKLKLHRIESAISDCVSLGIRPTTSFILGFPDENPQDVSATIRLSFRCAVAGARRSFINLLSAYTGTPVMRQFADKLRFERDAANSTMISFLAEKHYSVIIADPYIFSNYYSYPYEGEISARDYLDIVDFYTICLFKYPYFVDYLLNVAAADPLVLFHSLTGKIRNLGAAERNALAFELDISDIPIPQLQAAVADAQSALAVDTSAGALSAGLHDIVLYRGTVSPFSTGSIEDASAGIGEIARCYLRFFADGDIVSREIGAEECLLFQHRGIPLYGSERIALVRELCASRQHHLPELQCSS